MKTIISISTLFLLLSACSAKEINSNTNSIVGDVTKAFDGSKDKSAN